MKTKANHILSNTYEYGPTEKLRHYYNRRKRAGARIF